METSRLVPMYRELLAKGMAPKIRFEPTRRCNLKCVHCKAVTSNTLTDEINIEDIHNIMPQLKEAGVFEVTLSGGEVFARPDILELLAAFVEHDFVYAISTNGTLLCDEHFEFLSAHRDKFIKLTVSMYGGTPEVHEAVTRVPGSFSKTFATAQRLKEMDYPFAVFCMLMKANAAHWKETEAFFKEQGIFHQFGGLIVSREDGCTLPLELRAPDEILEELPISWEEYLNPDPESMPENYGPDTPISEWCVAGRYCNIQPNGDFAVCSVIREPVGNLRKQTFREIYESSELLKYFRGLTAGDLDCFGCEYFPRCRPCPGMAHEEHGSYTARPLEYCRMTKQYLGKEK